MFDTKPPTASEEFDQLLRLLGTAGVAEVLARRPESISRLKSRGRYTRPLERLVDDVWTVVHVAVTQARWGEDQVRAFLLLRRPELDQRPAAELIRDGRTEEVLRAIHAVPVEETRGARRRTTAIDPERRAAAQRRLADRGLHGLDRDRLLAAGREAWETDPDAP